MQLVSMSLGAIFVMLTTGIANADFLEDISSTPTEKTINDILKYCESNPNGDITADLVKTGKVSEFYMDYTCDQAAGDKEWIDNDRNPDANSTGGE